MRSITNKETMMSVFNEIHNAVKDILSKYDNYEATAIEGVKSATLLIGASNVNNVNDEYITGVVTDDVLSIARCYSTLYGYFVLYGISITDDKPCIRISVLYES